MNHKNVSFVKSGIRVIAGACLISGYVLAAGIFLIAAEVLGVLEEVVEEK